MSLFTELQRRSVFKVGIAYLVVAWLVIQVAATVAPQLALPEWAPRFVTLIVMLGFPVALVLAWVFDVTPEGLKVEPAPTGNKRMFAIAGVLALAAIGWYWKGQPASEAGAAARSIAVLPFANMSGDPNAEYFSDGISEEILNVLARTPELSVAARTSSFAYKGKTDDIPRIARELKVRMVLEGSVRKQGERVRITAQLIDAETGYHAWSQTYDRDLKDIFAIQDEIARAIGNELKVLVGGASAASGASVSGTTDLEAHDLYLRALALWTLRRGDKIWEAIATLEQAVAKDPEYAQAYGGLALAYAVIPDYSTKIGYRESYARSTDAAEMALALDPTLAEAFAALANTAIADRRRTTGHALYRRAIASKPSFATAHQWFGTALMSAGEAAEGIVLAARASELDPRSLVVGQNLAVVLQSLGRYDESIAACERVLAFAPDYSGCHAQIGIGHLMRGAPEQARPYLTRYAELDNPSAVPQVGRLIDALTGKGDARAVAQQIAVTGSRSYLEQGSGTNFSLADAPLVLVMLGEPGLALDYLERTAAEEGGVPEWAMMMPAADPIRCDARFVALIAKLKTKDPRHAQVCGGKS